MGLIFFANTDRARDSTIFAISTFGLGISVNDLYQGNAIQKEIPKYIEKIKEIAGNGKHIVLTGKGPIWLYLTLAHALHGKIKTLKYRSPEAEDILIMEHSSH